MGKIKLTLEDLFNVPSVVIYNPDCYKPVSIIEIDSRKVKKGSLFVAIKGEHLDGHDFVFDAVKKGANAIVINANKLNKFNNLEIPVATVDDTTLAYGELAKIWRKKLNAKIISLTGSNGKTTTKEMLAVLLAEKFNVVKTEANNNNHIGVPLTIFSADEKCEALVLEQGTNHFGEIEYSAKISQPDYALITNIGDSHLEFLKNRNGVYKEKSALLKVTAQHGGLVFINNDDPILSKTKKNYQNKVIYGFKGAVDVKGKIFGFTEDRRTKIQITYNKKSFNVTLPVYGESSANNFLAASAIALKLGLTQKQIIGGAQKLKPVYGRLAVKKFKNAVLIDDTYNSNPESVKAAVEVVKKIKTYNCKIIVLGDMFELGKSSEKLHKGLAKIFTDKKNLIVLTLGDKMKILHTALTHKKIKSIHFNSREALSLYLRYEEIENSVILVKGSRGMKMEEFVNQLEKRFE